MGGCASKPGELKGEMDDPLVVGEPETMLNLKIGEEEYGHQSLGFLLKEELEANEAEQSKKEHLPEESEAETVASLSDGKSGMHARQKEMVASKEEEEEEEEEEEDVELPVSSLVNIA